MRVRRGGRPLSVRVLVAGVGYRNLRDHSVGVAVVDLLATRSWSGDVVVEDLSYGPVAVVQRLEDEPAERAFTLAVFVGSVARGLRPPGTVTAYRWDGMLPDAEHVQAAVTEAVTGVIALDNTLIVARHFGALPAVVCVVEVEPEVEAFGDAFSPSVEAAFEPVCALVTRLATSDAAAEQLPVTGLGGHSAPRSVVP